MAGPVLPREPIATSSRSPRSTGSSGCPPAPHATRSWRRWMDTLWLKRYWLAATLAPRELRISNCEFRIESPSSDLQIRNSKFEIRNREGLSGCRAASRLLPALPTPGVLARALRAQSSETIRQGDLLGPTLTGSRRSPREGFDRGPGSRSPWRQPNGPHV